MKRGTLVVLCGVLALIGAGGSVTAADGGGTARRPADDVELRAWLENMVGAHQFSLAEVGAATGMSLEEVQAALRRFRIGGGQRGTGSGGRLRVLPYPGGRHPRIGFLEGAIDPQRETKVSVFTPWDESGYVVVDVPEAIWHQHGLLYLAHTHIPTVWDRRNVRLEPLEWRSGRRGRLEIERRLPDGVRFGARVRPRRDRVEFELWLVNDSRERLEDLRVQNCVMLKGAPGFDAQTNANKVLQAPFAAVGDATGGRWIITAWESCNRAWANAPVPCLHSDPKFDDCGPGERRRLRGCLWFYEGTDVQGEMERLKRWMGRWERRPGW